jgi:xanthine phosphoribosyltransferase
MISWGIFGSKTVFLLLFAGNGNSIKVKTGFKAPECYNGTMYYGYDEFAADAKELIEKTKPYRPDLIIGIARGGMLLAQVLGYGNDLRNVQTIHAESYDNAQRRDHVDVSGSCDFSGAERVLVVDDIVDSGETLRVIMERFRSANPGVTFKTASLFYKPSACVQPDFAVKEAKEWIHFFWEVDFG